jgi:hypothetical protein
MVPSENILVGKLFLTVISRRTYYIARISTGSIIFLETNSQKIWFPWVHLEITVRNEVFSETIHAGTVFFSRRNQEIHIFWELVARKRASR